MKFSVRPLGEGHARGQTGTFGIRRDGRHRLSVPQHPHLGPRPVRHRGDQYGHAPAAHRRVHAGFLGETLDTEFVDAVDMHLSRLRGGGRLTGRRRDQHIVVRDVQYRAHMQLRARERAFAEGQYPCPALVGDPHELSRGAPARHASEKIKPLSIFVGVHHPGRPGVRVDRQEQLTALVPRLYQNQRCARR